MTIETKIVKSVPEDAEEIFKLQREAYQSEALLYGDFDIQPLTETLGEVEAEYNIKGGVILKAVCGGSIIGSVRAYADGNTAYIGKLMVLPQYQNRGLGKRLLQAIELEFTGKRCELFTGAKSEKNLALYEKCGYTRFKEEAVTADLKFVYLEK